MLTTRHWPAGLCKPVFVGRCIAAGFGFTAAAWPPALRTTRETGASRNGDDRRGRLRPGELWERSALARASGNCGPIRADTRPARVELLTYRSACDGPRCFFAARRMQRRCLPLSEWVSPGWRRGPRVRREGEQIYWHWHARACTHTQVSYCS